MLRWWSLCAIAAIACREPDRSSKSVATKPGTKAAAVGASRAVPGTTDEPPSEIGHERVRADHATAFEAEPVDKPWADATVQEILQLVPDATRVACRRDQCELTIEAASDPELSSKLSAVQEEQSLGGIAQALIPLPPDTSADGMITMRIYVRFDRSAP